MACNMIKNALYELQPVLDDPRYEGFGFVRTLTLRGSHDWKGLLSNDFNPDIDEFRRNPRTWQVPRMARCWTPQPVIGRVRSFNDYPTVGGSVPAFSRRAVDALRDLLEPNGELLPLVSDVGEYYAYNVITVADILDQERSKLQLMSLLDVYECLPDKMHGLAIFRLVDKFTGTYVAEPFVERVKQRGLRGFHFAKLWPLPPGVNWFEEDKKQWKQELQSDTDVGRVPVKGNTVVLCISLAGKEPSDAERIRTKKLMAELGAVLYDPGTPPDATYLGSVEGDQFVPGESWVFLSCPGADALVEKLRPWLRKLSREVPMRVLKRYGEYVDGDARAEWVEL